MHLTTSFDEIGARADIVRFVDGEDVVVGRLALEPDRGWVGVADWTTVEVISR
ncbi:MAG: hypothetical protein U0869_19710 [Chloroflexota bacterium]